MISPLDFSRLRGRLVGLSDRLLDQHLALYHRYVDELNALDAAAPLPATPVDPPGEAAALDAPVAGLTLRPAGPLADAIRQVVGELRARGIPFEPGFYLGDEDFWTADRSTSINVPWFLANRRTWALADRNPRLTFTPDDATRCLRHEVGHAVGYAHEVWRRPDWRELFGDMDAPYPDEYAPDPSRAADHVAYLRSTPRHYAQKHPDEDWAEAFAAWLDPSWEPGPELGPRARAKLAYVERVARELLVTGPTHLATGKRYPYRTLAGTVRQRLGLGPGAPADPGLGAAAARRAAWLRNAVALHEHHFAALGTFGGAPGPALARAANDAYGSLEAWGRDLRQLALAAVGGWALAVWDARRGRLANVLVDDHSTGVPAGMPVLLALDGWEHAYLPDGLPRYVGLDAQLRNVSWPEVDARLLAVGLVPLT